MEDVAAVKVILSGGVGRVFITWGIIQNIVDPSELESFVLRRSQRCSMGGEPVRAEICDTLREPSSQRYFCKAPVKFSQNTVPVGETYQEWRNMKDLKMESGGEIYYLGRD